MIGPDESFRLPVSVFTADASIKDVKLEVQTDAHFTRRATSATTIAFTRPEEKLGFLALKSGTKVGKGRIRIIATSGKFRAESEVWLEVRSPNVYQSRFERTTLAPGASWNTTLKGFGLDGTQVATLEVSALPPVNLDGRMQYLIHYPHGCLEQTTSARVPAALSTGADQAVAEPAPAGGEQCARRHRAVARRCSTRAAALPTGRACGARMPALEWRNDWGTTYAGHFMLEAEKSGYALPGDMKAAWVRYQKERAQRWTPRRYQWPGEKEERRHRSGAL